MSPRHPYTIFWNCHYCGKAELYFCIDLAKVFFRLPPRHPYTIFWNFHYRGKGTLSFCFDLDKLFLQGATTPSLNQNIFLELTLF